MFHVFILKPTYTSNNTVISEKCLFPLKQYFLFAKQSYRRHKTIGHSKTNIIKYHIIIEQYTQLIIK